MKKQFKGSLIYGVTFFVVGLLGPAKFLGISLRPISIDTLIITGSLFGMLCAYIAYKKNKNPEHAFFAGFFLEILALIYYAFAKSGMTEREQELHEWKMKKEYEEMLAEKAKKQ